MPTTLGESYHPNWNGYPPHMSYEDLEIWKVYKNKLLPEALSLYYDVGLGGQTETPPDTSPEMSKMWIRNTQKRADVIVDTGDTWIIIELRSNATASGAGRLLQYKALWNEDPPDDRPVNLRLVTNMYDRDVEMLCKRLDIWYIVV